MQEAAQNKDPGRGINLKYWNPEDAAFWSSHGSRIASRNLWISIPNLLCGFAVWLYWSIIIVQMQNLHALRLGTSRSPADKSLALHPAGHRRSLRERRCAFPTPS